MLLSRTLARRRIARGVRPGLVGAWGPVLVDMVAIVALLIAVTPWVARVIHRADGSGTMILVVGVVVYFVPSQIVIAMSSLWAVKSRWSDDP